MTVNGHGLAALLATLAAQRVIRLIQPSENEAKFGVRGEGSSRTPARVLLRSRSKNLSNCAGRKQGSQKDVTKVPWGCQKDVNKNVRSKSTKCVLVALHWPKAQP